MAFLIAVLLFAVLSLLSYFVINIYLDSSPSMELRFKVVGDIIQRRTDPEVEKLLTKSFSERILIPLGRRFADRFKGFTPVAVTQLVEQRLVMAGGMAGLTADQFIAVTGLITGAAVAASVLLSFLLNFGLAKMVGAILYALVLGLFLPHFMLSRKISARQASIQKDLPDVLDLITVSVEAGLGFDGALAKLAEKMKGTLVDEFSRVLQEMRMGVSRKEALKGMSSRCGNKDLSLFVTSLIQADQLGVSIGNVLRVQALGIRQNRRLQIEQKANKTPVYILLPLILCIFPSLYIILLGPAVLRVFTMLAK
ncbi:type ii secretion system (t2ss) protein f [Lucifera butyrica]|uniref:Type ii secretion system (T2ss) protein f n=1 Tax=Lucifera butyrica TaxID=1351585 RepID=A0A498RIE2_9FIRM|nr:type II secretion system F family protein [Lucifera butyrica]VBB08868.1 type ii secretion system (t2ss) protein f [Lucifera butyrica]